MLSDIVDLVNLCSVLAWPSINLTDTVGEYIVFLRFRSRIDLGQIIKVCGGFLCVNHKMSYPWLRKYRVYINYAAILLMCFESHHPASRRICGDFSI